jgi:hypothetical protein
MAKEKRTTYDQLAEPYDSLMMKSDVNAIPNGQFANTNGNGNVESQPVKSDGASDDVWIKNFIRSANWSPKKKGFYIDGRTGYAEFSNVFVSGDISASTISGSTISGTTISGGSITIGSNFSVTTDGNMSASGGTFTGTIRATAGFIENLNIYDTITVGDNANSGIIESYGYDGTTTGFRIQGGPTPIITVIGGTITGGTIQTSPSTSSVRVVMDGSDNKLKFMNTTVVYGSVYSGIFGVSASGMIMETSKTGPYIWVAEGAHEQAEFGTQDAAVSFYDANFFLPMSDADPAIPTDGSVYYNTTSHKIKVYTGAGWETVTSA